MADISVLWEPFPKAEGFSLWERLCQDRNIRPSYYIPWIIVTFDIIIFFHCRIWNVTVPTSGLVMYTFCTAICDHISLYGFYPFTRDSWNRPIYNHYYDKTVIDFETDTIHEYHKEFKMLKELHKNSAVKLVTIPCR